MSETNVGSTADVGTLGSLKHCVVQCGCSNGTKLLALLFGNMTENRISPSVLHHYAARQLNAPLTATLPAEKCGFQAAASPLARGCLCLSAWLLLGLGLGLGKEHRHAWAGASIPHLRQSVRSMTTLPTHETRQTSQEELGCINEAAWSHKRCLGES